MTLRFVGLPVVRPLVGSDSGHRSPQRGVALEAEVVVDADAMESAQIVGGARRIGAPVGAVVAVLG